MATSRYSRLLRILSLPLVGVLFYPLMYTMAIYPNDDTSGANTRDVARSPSMFLSYIVEVPDAQYASLDGLASGSRKAQDRQRRAVAKLGLPLEVKSRKTEISLRLIPAGTFTMGRSHMKKDSYMGPSEKRPLIDESHQVALTKDFYCGKFEVTQRQWQAVMGKRWLGLTPGRSNAPITEVTWEDCQMFVNRLCQKEGVSEGTYRLLTEAEWEYACRAGTLTSRYWGDSSEEKTMNRFCWYRENTRADQATPKDIGLKLPNSFGLYDMIGNAWEWCQDWYGVYPPDSVTDPTGPYPDKHRSRILRGGWMGG